MITMTFAMITMAFKENKDMKTKKLYAGEYCGNCPHNDGLVYASLPPRFRCTFTNEYHLGTDCCNVEVELKVKNDKTSEGNQ